ncbi:hypothetical protein L3Q82_001152 [Scortum barcoo]|uniref:Uncharacterized protein n=1 Tax=Scortum barcoo TaxID=214431 RepID=A0ACB8WBL4_9TELE|nr:hypothetical protein L3Q82_001152 [Scortum barcoo]
MRHGCDTVIASRNLDKLKEAAKKLSAVSGRRCLPVCIDVRQPESIAAAVDETLKEFGRIDILINNAAGNFLCPAISLSFNAFKTVLEIDTMGTFNTSKIVFEKWFQNHGGNIVNISATLGYRGQALQVHAGSAKAANDAMTKHLAVEWGPSGVRVNAVAPGPVSGTEGFRRLDDTTVVGLIRDGNDLAYREEVEQLVRWKIQPSHAPLLINNSAVEVVSSTKFLGVNTTDDLTWSVNSVSLVKRAQQHLHFLRRMKRAHLAPAHPHYVLQEHCGPIGEAAGVFQSIPLQRAGNKTEMAHCTLFLASRASSYVTGAILVADGGAWLTSATDFSMLSVVCMRLEEEDDEEDDEEEEDGTLLMLMRELSVSVINSGGLTDETMEISPLIFGPFRFPTGSEEDRRDGRVF